jgi:Skp family chaperone for outer membrane proteins
MKLIAIGAFALASLVASAAEARMEQLSQEVQGELTPYGTAIQTEIQTLQQSGAGLPEAERNSRSQALQQRIQEAQQLEQTRDNELRYTLSEQRRLISVAVEPILVAIYQERGCGLLLSREGVFMMNPAMDVTDLAIQRLNTALPTLSFNRLPVPVQQPGQ